MKSAYARADIRTLSRVDLRRAGQPDGRACCRRLIPVMDSRVRVASIRARADTGRCFHTRTSRGFGRPVDRVTSAIMMTAFAGSRVKARRAHDVPTLFGRRPLRTAQFGS